MNVPPYTKFAGNDSPLFHSPRSSLQSGLSGPPVMYSQWSGQGPIPQMQPGQMRQNFDPYYMPNNPPSDVVVVEEPGKYNGSHSGYNSQSNKITAQERENRQCCYIILAVILIILVLCGIAAVIVIVHFKFHKTGSDNHV